jgi:sphinganine-1-phosphate aldolase
MSKQNSLPKTKQKREDILKELYAARDKDAKWKEGKTFSLVFYAGEEILSLIKEAYTAYFSENGLNPSAFPSLKKFESEVVRMTLTLLNGNKDTSGSMTSGGTESILMAVKTAKSYAMAKNPKIEKPEMVVSASAHPAFDKAAYYFGIKIIKVPVRGDYRADVEAMENAITQNTILMVGSAPQYPQGVVDPIAELGKVAQKRNILLHVDACVGGFMLPFVRKLGYPVP